MPDYTNIVNAALNKTPKRLPLYEHIISDQIMEKIANAEFSSLLSGNKRDKEEYFNHCCGFFKRMGYDTVSFECCASSVFPFSGCLGNHAESVISSYQDFLKYPWDGIADRYFESYGDCFEALRSAMPEGMKAVGGVGNGIFECVQDIVGYVNLCYIASDEPELYDALFRKVGEICLDIWDRFLKLYGDIYCVLRFGDDLGFKSNTLISADDIRRLIVPEYAKIISKVHEYKKPFLLHSCGSIFNVMPDLIHIAKIDAKHSNEDQIAPFQTWVEKYGSDIGNFGGMDTDAICSLSLAEIKDYVNDVLKRCKNAGGIAFGSGNSIPPYVPAENYVHMVEAVRVFRGE
jgi:uroporphyrinogen decarboxylase